MAHDGAQNGTAVWLLHPPSLASRAADGKHRPAGGQA
jgi:hypothetical protein